MSIASPETEAQIRANDRLVTELKSLWELGHDRDGAMRTVAEISAFSDEETREVIRGKPPRHFVSEIVRGFKQISKTASAVRLEVELSHEPSRSSAWTIVDHKLEPINIHFYEGRSPVDLELGKRIFVALVKELGWVKEQDDLVGWRTELIGAEVKRREEMMRMFERQVPEPNRGSAGEQLFVQYATAEEELRSLRRLSEIYMGLIYPSFKAAAVSDPNAAAS